MRSTFFGWYARLTSGETELSSAAGWFGFSTSQMKLMRGRESSMRWNRKIEYDATKRCGPSGCHEMRVTWRVSVSLTGSLKTATVFVLMVVCWCDAFSPAK